MSSLEELGILLKSRRANRVICKALQITSESLPRKIVFRHKGGRGVYNSILIYAEGGIERLGIVTREGVSSNTEGSIKLEDVTLELERIGAKRI